MEKDFENEVIARLTKIETKIDDYNSFKEKADNAIHLSQENAKRIAELENNSKWFKHTTLGAVITGTIAVIFMILESGLGMPQ